MLAHPPVSMARFRTRIPADKSPGWEQGLAAAPLVMVAIVRSSCPACSTPCPQWVGGWLCPVLPGCPGDAVTHPRARGSPFPAPCGSCSSSSPGVQVMLQPGSTSSTEPGEQRWEPALLPEAFSCCFPGRKTEFFSFSGPEGAAFLPRVCKSPENCLNGS